MKHKWIITAAVIVMTAITTITVTATTATATAAPLQVVSSFSILDDLVQQVGGSKVQSHVLVGPEGDSHNFEPKPSHTHALQGADLVVVNGADFEAWLPRLTKAANYTGLIIEATTDIPLRAYESVHSSSHEHGRYDPHAWQSLEHAQFYVQNIRDALIAADPENKNYYKQRAKTYTRTMADLHSDLLAKFEKLPASQRTVVSSHDAFAYLGQAYGLEFLSLLGASNQAEPSAKELAELIRYMREHHVSAVFIESISSPSLSQQLARETKAVLSEKHLYSDALAKAPHPASTFLGMMRWNAEALLDALQP